WAARRPRSAPEVTELQLSFIRASEEEADARSNAERRRLAEMAAAQEARAKALDEAQAALRQVAEAQRRRATLRNLLLVVMTLAAGISGWLGWQAKIQSDAAKQQTVVAQQQRDVAEKQTILAKQESERAQRQSELAARRAEETAR